MTEEAKRIIGVILPVFVGIFALLLCLHGRGVETDSRTRGLQRQMQERAADIAQIEAAIEDRRRAHESCREERVGSKARIDTTLVGFQRGVNRLLRQNGAQPDGGDK